MARVYFKDGTIMEGRRCSVKRAIITKLKFDGRVPYRFRPYTGREINAFLMSAAWDPVTLSATRSFNRGGGSR